MKTCPACGGKLGFFGKTFQCKICDKALCDGCRKFDAMVWIETKHDYDNEQMTQFSFCSEKCIFKFYSDYIETTPPNDIILENIGNVSIGISSKKLKTKSILISYSKANPREAGMLNNFIPELLPLYANIKADLNSRKIQFKEESSGL